jgi:hypothetical protein
MRANTILHEIKSIIEEEIHDHDVTSDAFKAGAYKAMLKIMKKIDDHTKHESDFEEARSPQ